MSGYCCGSRKVTALGLEILSVNGGEMELCAPDVIVLCLFSRTGPGVGSELLGCLRQPLLEEGTSMPVAVTVLRFPRFAVTSWGLPDTLRSEGTDSFCPQNLAQRKSSKHQVFILKIKH